MGSLVDLSGERFGRLFVVCRGGTQTSKCGGKRPLWLCRCDCGKTVLVDTTHLKRGNTQSCGCLHKEGLAKRNSESATHGAKRSGQRDRLYGIWISIKGRCYKENDDAYKYYGERGIKMCDEWANDYVAFSNWANCSGYQEDLSIDRIDCNGNYEPSNCRWVTAKTQANNRRNNVLITYNGKTKTISEWADETGLSQAMIRYRHKAGWEVQKIFEQPNKRKRCEAGK